VRISVRVSRADIEHVEALQPAPALGFKAFARFAIGRPVQRMSGRLDAHTKTKIGVGQGLATTISDRAVGEGTACFPSEIC
jgi:hypothetical protein